MYTKNRFSVRFFTLRRIVPDTFIYRHAPSHAYMPDDAHARSGTGTGLSRPACSIRKPPYSKKKARISQKQARTAYRRHPGPYSLIPTYGHKDIRPARGRSSSADRAYVFTRVVVFVCRLGGRPSVPAIPSASRCREPPGSAA